MFTKRAHKYHPQKFIASCVPTFLHKLHVDIRQRSIMIEAKMAHIKKTQNYNIKHDLSYMESDQQLYRFI